MKYTNLTYQSAILNRLAALAYRKGGTEAMRTSLDNATMKIWDALDTVYGRSPDVIRAGHNMRQTL